MLPHDKPLYIVVYPILKHVTNMVATLCNHTTDKLLALCSNHVYGVIEAESEFLVFIFQNLQQVIFPHIYMDLN